GQGDQGDQGDQGAELITLPISGHRPARQPGSFGQLRRVGRVFEVPPGRADAVLANPERKRRGGFERQTPALALGVRPVVGLRKASSHPTRRAAGRGCVPARTARGTTRRRPGPAPPARPAAAPAPPRPPRPTPPRPPSPRPRPP